MNDRFDQDPEGQELWKSLKRKGPAPERTGCPQADELAAYVEGRARGIETEQMDAHLAQCPACLQAVQEIRNLLQEPLLEAPETLITRAQDLVAAPEPQGSWLEGLIRTLVPLSTGALVFCFVSVTGLRMGYSMALNINQAGVLSRSIFTF